MNIVEEGIRSFALEGNTHDVDEKTHRVVVHFPFERMDSYRSDFGKGWCDDYLATHRPVMVVHHNPRDLIGRMVPDGYRNLGGMAEIVGGFSDFDSVPLAREYFAHIRDDEIPGWSYHYRNARGIPHPSGTRAAVRYMKAEMPEFGPTPFPAIPGAGAVGLRSEEPTLSVPTITEIIALGKELSLDSEGIRSMVAEHYPGLVDHITIVTQPKTLSVAGFRSDAGEAIAAFLEQRKDDVAELSEGERAFTITIGDDGSVSTDGGGAATGETDDNPATLASAIDAALDAAAVLLDGVDVTMLPDEVQQAIALTSVAGIAADELLSVMGIDDPDDPVEGQRSEAEINEAEGNRSVVSGKIRDELPDSAFAYVEDGGTKDDSGRTEPRKLRHFPIQDKAHVDDALARIGQGAKFSAEAKPKVETAAKKFGIDTSGGTRSDPVDEPVTPTQSEIAAAALARIKHADAPVA